MMTETPGRLREMWALHATLQGQPEEDALEFAAELDELLPVERLSMHPTGSGARESTHRPA